MDFKQLLFRMLVIIIRAMSPEFKAAICRLLRELEQKAKSTENPVDDAIVECLKGLFACDEE